MRSVWKVLKAAFYYLRETDHEKQSSEMAHLLGHIEYELKDLQKMFPTWIPGTGKGLEAGTYAYVHHPKLGVMFAHLGWQVETDSNGEHKWWDWTDYTKGVVVMADEITHYIPLMIGEPEPVEFGPADIYSKIWDILVEHGGATANEKTQFLQAMLTNSTQEYRFCGHFGFGGKFWRDEGNFYVNYYPEDSTDSRENRRDRINYLLRSLTSR